jgi:hypothetical protein
LPCPDDVSEGVDRRRQALGAGDGVVERPGARAASVSRSLVMYLMVSKTALAHTACMNDLDAVVIGAGAAALRHLARRVA